MFDEEANPEKAADAAFDWQQSRRREDGHFDVPVQGFAGGKLTIWLPTSDVQSRYVFKDGRPVRETTQSCMATPEIAALRDDVIRSFRGDGVNEPVSADIKFLEYVAAVIKLNYNVSDDDLTALLEGTKWHNQMIQHLCGGEQFLETVLKLAPTLITMHSPLMALPETRPPAPLLTVAAKTSLFHRLMFWKRA